MTHTLLITGVPGLEDLLADELRELPGVSHTSHTGHGIVFAHTDALSTIATLNRRLRQAERVLLLLGHATDIHTLDDARAFADTLPFSPHLHAERSFAIRATRRGEHHTFTSQNLARDIGSAVVQQFRDRHGTRLAVDLETPDIIFHAILHDTQLYIALDTTGDRDLLERYPRPFHHFAPLRPHIAAAMLRFAGFHEARDTPIHLLDPMAGGGTIPTEAAMLATGRASTALREAPFAYTLTPSLHDIAAEPDLEPRGWQGVITSSDRFLKNMRGMHENIAAAGFADTIQIVRGDATRLDEHTPKTIDLIVTNPPFGLRISDTRSVERLYIDMLRSAQRVGVPRYIALTPQRGFLRHAANCMGYREIQHRHVYYGKLQAGLFELALEKT